MNVNIKTHHDVEKKKLLDNKIIFFFILLLFFVSTLVAYMYIRNDLDSLIASNLTIKSDNDQLQQKVIYLESEIIDLKKPGQIQKIAKEELGMVNSIPQADVIFVKKNK